MSEVFRKIAASEGRKDATYLNEVEFLRFLTAQNRTMTRDQMRKTFAACDFDKNNGISFLEWLLFRYEKTVADVMTEPDPLPADVRDELNASLKEYQEAMGQERVFTDKISELEKQVEGGGVKGNLAKAELEALKNKFSAEKVRIEKIKLQAEKKRRASLSKAQGVADQLAKEKEEKLQAELTQKEREEKEKKEKEALDRASKKKALQGQWEGK